MSDSVNYITAHDGFTLADLVSYAERRNQANGEAGRDGHPENHSWNGGVEGPSDDPVIRARRAADARAMLATLLLARGTPMLGMGDEAGRSQHGNNNAYAQDNAISWFDWAGIDTVLRDFTARLVRARLAHPALTADRPLTGLPQDATGIPDVAWRHLDGRSKQAEHWGRRAAWSRCCMPPGTGWRWRYMGRSRPRRWCCHHRAPASAGACWPTAPIRCAAA
ncbi:hypothetical protein ACFQU2_32020 [Siccirubricoccus deserti]